MVQNKVGGYEDHMQELQAITIYHKEIMFMKVIKVVPKKLYSGWDNSHQAPYKSYRTFTSARCYGRQIRWEWHCNGEFCWTEVLIPAARWQLVILGRLHVRLTDQTNLTGLRAGAKIYTHQPLGDTHTWTSHIQMNIYVQKWQYIYSIYSQD